MNHPIITIGREVGSGGLTLGRLLSEQLNIPLYDKELLSIASQQSGLCREVFERADEKEGIGFLQKAFGSVLCSYDNYIGSENLFKIQSDAIREIAAKESAIFVGRCADYVLRDHKQLLRIFVGAAIADRQKSVARKFDIDDTEAIKLIERTDKQRSTYYNFYTNKQWGHSSSYDICINTSLIGVKKASDIVLKIYKDLFFCQ